MCSSSTTRVGKTHLAVALGRAVVEAGHSVLFTSATALLGALSALSSMASSPTSSLSTQAQAPHPRRARYLPFEKRSAHLFFQLVARRYEKGSLLVTTNQLVGQWGSLRRLSPRRGDPRSTAAPQPHLLIRATAIGSE